MFNKTIITVITAVALGCMPIATNTLAADHPGGGHSGGHALSRHAMGGHVGGGYARGGQGARYGDGHYRGAGPIYDTCDGYYGNGCPGFGVPYVGGDKWRAGWLLTVIGKFGSRAPPFGRVKNATVRFGLSAAKQWPADMIKHHRLATSQNISAASTCLANAAPVAVYRNELRHECKIFRNFPLAVPKLGPAHAVNPEKPNLAYCAICAPPNAEDGLGVSMFGNIDV